MNSVEKSRAGGWRTVVECAFWGGFLLVVCKLINPAATFYAAGPSFLSRWEINQSFWMGPGAAVYYGGALLAYAGQSPWAGAAAITLLAAMAAQCCALYLARSSGRLLRLEAHCLPPVLFLVVLSRYEAPALAILLAALLVSALALAGTFISNAKARAIFWALALAAAEWLGGPCSAAALGLMAGVFEWLRHGNRALSAGAIGLGVAVAGISAAWVQTPPGFGLWGWGHKLSETAAVLFALCVPAAALAARFFKKPAPQPAPSPKTAGKKAHRAAAKSEKPNRWPSLWRAALIDGSMLAAAFAVIQSLDVEKRGLLLVDFHAQRQEWNAALQTAQSLPASTVASRLQTLRALYYLGQLPERQFEFDQIQRLDLFGAMDRGAGPEFCLPQACALLELGQVNLAEHFASESLEILGNRPETLEVLAKINMAKGRMPVARLYLNFLAQHPFHRAWALRYLAAMETDPALKKDSELALIRQSMAATDITSNNEPSYMLLEQLLEANPANRMAFEYLMANDMLTLDLDKMVQRLDSEKLSPLPRYYQEAILMRQWIHKDEPAPAIASAVSAQTRERFERFQKIFSSSGGKEKAVGALLAEFPDSYWFFALYGGTPGALTRRMGGPR